MNTPTELEIAPKMTPLAIAMPRVIPYNDRQTKSHNFIREGIAMSLRKVAGAIALLAVISVIGGGGNHGSSPIDTLGLLRLASLRPRRPHYGHSGIPGGEPGQDPLLRP